MEMAPSNSKMVQEKSHRALIDVLPGQKSRLVTRDPLDPVFIDASEEEQMLDTL